MKTQYLFLSRITMLIAVVITFPSFSLSAQWKQCNGPFGGDIKSFAVIETSLFVVANENTIFRSTDNGDNWRVINIEGTMQYISAIAASGTSLFAATINNGIFLSTDEGENWQPSNKGLTNLDVRTIAVSGTTLFAGTFGGGLFRSTDNGQNWMPPNTELPDKEFMTICVRGTMEGREFHD